MEQGVAKLLTEGGSLAILGMVLWAIAAKAVPAFLRALREQQSAFLEALAKRDAHHEVVISKVASEHAKAVDKMATAIAEHTVELQHARRSLTSRTRASDLPHGGARA